MINSDFKEEFNVWGRTFTYTVGGKRCAAHKQNRKNRHRNVERNAEVCVHQFILSQQACTCESRSRFLPRVQACGCRFCFRFVLSKSQSLLLCTPNQRTLGLAQQGQGLPKFRCRAYPAPQDSHRSRSQRSSGSSHWRRQCLCRSAYNRRQILPLPPSIQEIRPEDIESIVSRFCLRCGY